MSKKEVWPLIISSFIILIFYILFYYYKNDNSEIDQIIRKQKAHKKFLEFSESIRDIWFQGRIRRRLESKIKSCMRNGPQDFLRCNPDYLNCVLAAGVKNFDPGIKVIPFTQDRFLKVVARSLNQGIGIPRYGVVIKVLVDKFKFQFALEDFCGESYLPQRVYAHGPFKAGEEDWRWDNFNRIIIVDKHLVTNREYLEWKNLLGHPVLKKKMNLSSPVVHLLPDEMMKFCSFRGKQLMNSLVFDAATFFPGDLNKKRPMRVFRSPYPWSRVKSDAFLYQARYYEDFIFKNQYCKKAYTFECQSSFSYSSFQFKANSWRGLSNILGGKMEYMKNPVYPKENLKSSSKYFLATSKVHELGKRDFWNGMGHFSEHFSFEINPEIIPKSFEVGFRCMRYLSSVY
jgi:hypothetical protein